MSFKKCQWMFNTVGSEIWYGDYFETKEEAIAAGKEEYEGMYTRFIVGQIEPAHIPINVDAEHILENIKEVASDIVGEVADDYLKDVTTEDEHLLEKRLSVVIEEWMKEFDYTPKFFHIINTEIITLERCEK